jgi:hypothetical protein
VYDPGDMAPPDRSSWPIRAYRLGAEPPDNLSSTTTAEERLAMMWPLALAAWELGGQPMPGYTRAEAPIRRRGLRDAAASR